MTRRDPTPLTLRRGSPNRSSLFAEFFKTRALLNTRGKIQNRVANSLHAWKTQNPRQSLTKYPTSPMHGGVASLIGQVPPAAMTVDKGSPQIPQPPIVATIECGERQNSSHDSADHNGQR